MIHITRGSVERPEIFDSAKAKREFVRARASYARPEHERKRRHFPISLYRHISIKWALGKLFHGKCAYCESKYAVTQPMDVELFRPKGGIIGKDEYFPDHYWWLALDWNNCFSSCIACNRRQKHGGKGHSFPITGPRSPLLGGPEDLHAEKPLLLNPCEDQPQDHLVFHRDGMVSGTTERGQVTVEVLGLNRPQLVSDRAYHALRVVKLLQLVQTIDPTIYFDELIEMGADQGEYAGMSRQLIRTALVKYDDDRLRPLLDAIEPTSHVVTKKESRKAEKSRIAFEKDLESYTLADDQSEDDDVYRERLPQVETIVIHNVKAIRHLELNFTMGGGPTPSTDPDAEDPRAPWKMLIGENATGKSTVLKTVALALLGEDYLDHVLGDEAGSYVRNGCKSGYVRVQLSGFSTPHKLVFRKDGVEFSGPGRAQILLLGYGSMRLLEGDRKGAFEVSYARVDNLFDPTMPLGDLNGWLCGLHDQKDPKYHRACRALKQVMMLGEGEELEYKDGEMQVKLMDATIPIRRLSDGYQSSLALVGDIMQVVLERWHEPDLASGIVLVDEIGAHLHPIWKMHLASNLREALPNVQFLATTHDPLCLRGLDDGEVALLKRDAKKHVVGIGELPPVRALRVDQLLTSEHFGLSSTRDPEAEKFFAKYYALLGKRKRTKADERRLANLRQELPEHGLRGVTRRERIMLDAIDHHLAREPEHVGTPQARASQMALDEVLQRILSKIP